MTICEKKKSPGATFGKIWNQIIRNGNLQKVCLRQQLTNKVYETPGFKFLQKQRKAICKVVTWNWSLQNFQENGLQGRVCKMTHNGNLQNNLQQHLANNDLGRQLEKRVVWNENLPNLQKNNYKHDFPKRFNKRTNAKFLMFSWSSLTLLSPSTHCQARYFTNVHI